MRRNNREIQERVAENRRQTRKIDTTLVEVSARNERTLSFSRNFIEVEVELSLRTRDLNNTLISGHPDEQYGSGRGKGGDQRGEWEVTSVEISSNELVRQGRTFVRDSLNGEARSIGSVSIGTGSTPVFVSDESLVSLTEQKVISIARDESDTIRAVSKPFLFPDGVDAQEVGVYDLQGNMVGRSVTEMSFENSDKEYRPDVKLRVTGDGIGDSVVTDVGVTSITDTIETKETSLRFGAIALGSGETNPSVGDTSLEAEFARIESENEIAPEQINISSRLFRDEPGTQPVDVTEIGVYDTQDRLIWRSLVNRIEKNDKVAIVSTVGFNVQSA